MRVLLLLLVVVLVGVFCFRRWMGGWVDGCVCVCVRARGRGRGRLVPVVRSLGCDDDIVGFDSDAVGHEIFEVGDHLMPFRPQNPK